MNPNLLHSLFDGDAELQQELAALFLDISPQQLAAVRDAIEHRDAAALEFTAHAIKGSLSNFAASEALQAAQKLESMGRNRDWNQAADAFQVLEQQLRALRSTLIDFQKECVR